MDNKKLQRIIVHLAGTPGQRKRPKLMRRQLASYIRQLNSGSIEILPHERDVLGDACDEIDSETHAALAWAKVSDVNQLGVAKRTPDAVASVDAVARNLMSSTVAYVDMGGDTLDVASGVLVEIENRIFLATASHCIPPNPAERLSFIGKDKAKLPKGMTSIRNHGQSPDPKKIDVGFLEFDRKFVESKIQQTAIPLSRVNPSGTGANDRITMVCGYPAEVVRNSVQRSKRTQMEFTAQIWRQCVLPFSDWHVLDSRGRGPVVAWDVFVPYSITDETILLTEIKDFPLDRPPAPQGLSGGGYWQMRGTPRTLKQGIWSPDRYCLFAIQSHWWGHRQRYLQATQIIHWLKLVWQHNPDLRHAIKAEYPQYQFS